MTAALYRWHPEWSCGNDRRRESQERTTAPANAAESNATWLQHKGQKGEHEIDGGTEQQQLHVANGKGEGHDAVARFGNEKDQDHDAENEDEVHPAVPQSVDGDSSDAVAVREPRQEQ